MKKAMNQHSSLPLSDSRYGIPRHGHPSSRFMAAALVLLAFCGLAGRGHGEGLPATAVDDPQGSATGSGRVDRGG